MGQIIRICSSVALAIAVAPAAAQERVGLGPVMIEAVARARQRAQQDLPVRELSEVLPGVA